MKIFKQNCMNDFEQVESFDRDPIMESLLTIEILTTNELNYQVIDIGMGNYCQMQAQFWCSCYF